MKQPLLLGAFLVAAPTALLLPGCSGGTTGLGSIFPTPAPTTTPVAVSQTSNFTLGNGQRAILKTTRTGNALTGTIQILAPLAANRSASALTRSIKVGTFSITGTFTAPRGFNFTVKDGNETLFTMIGLFPTTTQAGSYSITTFDGQTDSGVLPISGAPTSTATPVPTGTTPPTDIPKGIKLVFTPSNPSNFVELPLKIAQFIPENISGRQRLLLTVSDSIISGAQRTQLFVQLGLAEPATGKKYTFPAANLRQAASFEVRSNQTGVEGKADIGAFFNAPQSGSITLVNLTGNSAAIRFQDVVVLAQNNAGTGTETVKVNGTVNGNFTAQ